MFSDPIITLHRVTKTFLDQPGEPLTAVSGISLAVGAGEIFMLLGPSGCGKSTLLRMMSRLEPPSSGTVSYGRGLAPSDISFVFQQFALLPWLTVSENIELGLVARGAPAERRREITKRELTRFGLEKFAHAHTRELSGGMRQRVGIARALATDPKVIFMDEPFSELDSFTAAELRRELLSIWQEQRPTIVMVTHLIEEALELGDRIAVLTSRPGKIEHVIENRLPRPRAKRAPDFFRLEDEIYALVRP